MFIGLFYLSNEYIILPYLSFTLKHKCADCEFNFRINIGWLNFMIDITFKNNWFVSKNMV